MKKTIGISLFIFFAIVVAVLIAGLIFYQNNKNTVNKNNNISTSKIKTVNMTSNSTSSVNINSSPKLTIAEVAKHNQINDCYMIISSKVYDLTSYSLSHPGGTRTIENSCGTDATIAYNTKGNRGRPHSSYASNLLDQYYLGNLVK